MKEAPFKMEEIFDFMQYDYQKYARNTQIFNMPCPDCDRAKNTKHLNVNLSKQRWRCPKCGAYGNAVNYYSFVTQGNYEMTADAYKAMIDSIRRGMDGNAAYQRRRLDATQKRTSKTPYIKSAEIATDDTLDHTYRTLLEFPAFVLKEAHRANLIKRGLNDAAIDRNGYRSFPSSADMKNYISQKIKRTYVENRWSKARAGMPRIERKGNDLIMFGLTVAAWLQKKGCVMEGVPGFFLFQNHWCFLMPEGGLVIPTRNRKGQIVALQVRTNGKTRYLTVSAGGLPSAVSENICRAHWPLASTSIQSGKELPKIILTEGPLKADVALHLLKSRNPYAQYAFVAIMGVTNTASLLRECDTLVKYGVTRIWNALDMDRLTNPNVANGSRRLRKALKEKSIDFKPMLWDERSARLLEEKQRSYCTENRIFVRVSDNPYVAVAQYTQAVHEKSGAAPFEWTPRTKGIDDYLRSLKQQ